jgi:hypothetical protein
VQLLEKKMHNEMEKIRREMNSLREEMRGGEREGEREEEMHGQVKPSSGRGRRSRSCGLLINC